MNQGYNNPTRLEMEYMTDLMNFCLAKSTAKMFFTESLFMKFKLELQQLSLNLVAKHYNPARITPDFLIASGIIPQDWKLASKLMVAQNKVQFRFKI